MKLPLLSIFFFFLLSIPAKSTPKTWDIQSQIHLTNNQPIELNLYLNLSLLNHYFHLPYIEKDSINKNKLEQLKIDTAALSQKFLTVYQYNQPLSLLVKSIKISNTSPDEAEELLKTDDTNLEIVMLISQTYPLTDFSIRWHLFPDSFLQQISSENKQFSPEDKTVKISIVEKEIQNFQLTSSSPELHWQSQTTFNSIDPTSEIQISKIITSHLKNALLIFAIVLFLIILLWIFLPEWKSKKIILLSLFLITLFLITKFDFSHQKAIMVKDLPGKKSDLEYITKNILSNLYSATAANSPGTLFERINQSASGNFLDKTFAEIYQAKVNDNATILVTEKIDLLSFRKINFRQIECTWQVKSHLQHLYHNHQKNLKFQGFLTLDYNGKNWLIDNAKIIPINFGEQL